MMRCARKDQTTLTVTLHYISTGGATVRFSVRKQAREKEGAVPYCCILACVFGVFLNMFCACFCGDFFFLEFCAGFLLFFLFFVFFLRFSCFFVWVCYFVFVHSTVSVCDATNHLEAQVGSPASARRCRRNVS